mgnify:FL=1
MPWKIRRLILIKLFHYEIHPTAKIGLSYIYPHKLKMEANSYIGHLNIAIHLNYIEMKKNSCISQRNWITGFPINTNSKHFSHDPNRKSELIIGQDSAITKCHHIDCTNSIIIGKFTTIAGYSSQFLTHSIDINEGRQDSKPITIGDYCFVSTRVIILGGSKLPSYSVLGAGAVLNKSFDQEWNLYAGIPAKATKELSKNAKYFNRKEGFIY